LLEDFEDFFELLLLDEDFLVLFDFLVGGGDPFSESDSDDSVLSIKKKEEIQNKIECK